MVRSVPLGVIGNPEFVIGARAREFAVMMAARAVTVKLRSPAVAAALNVADAPLEKVRTVPFGIPEINLSTTILVAEAAAWTAQVTIRLPVFKAIIRDV